MFIEQPVPIETYRKGFPVAGPVHYDRCHGGLVEGADTSGWVVVGICAQQISPPILNRFFSVVGLLRSFLLRAIW